jgi:hypothetical protein
MRNVGKGQSSPEAGGAAGFWSIQPIVAEGSGKIGLSMFGYEEIRSLLGGDDAPPRFLIHRHGLVLALCLHADAHPRINADPPEVWVGGQEQIREWGERLAMDTGAVWLFTANGEENMFRERGIYEILGSTNDRLELAKRMVFPGISSISRVVFLKRQPVVEVSSESELKQDSEF